MAHGGCFPIRLAGSTLVIGAITVSGLPQREDHDLLTRTLAEFLGVRMRAWRSESTPCRRRSGYHRLGDLAGCGVAVCATTMRQHPGSAH